jgi:AraC family transcriptional regulator
LAKIALDLERALAARGARGTPGAMTSRMLATGSGWTVADVVCTHGPQDRAYEERHTQPTIAVVLAGSFQYRCAAGYSVMTPGALLLGNAGRCFHCSHEHGEGDRCVAFTYEADYFERLATDAGVRGRQFAFPAAAVPALRGVSSFAVRASAGLLGAPGVSWGELAVGLAAEAVQLTAGISCAGRTPPPHAEARVSRIVRGISGRPDGALTLEALAEEATLSPFHFLRTFEQVTGVTPHQYVRRSRLREAATRLLTVRAKVLDIALECGFDDVSTFNRAFRAEFGVSPRHFRNGQ